MMRHGSASPDLAQLIDLARDFPMSTRYMMFCSDETDPADLVELSEEELGRLTGDEILELAESLGLHLDVNISREAALARLRLLSVE